MAIVVNFSDKLPNGNDNLTWRKNFIALWGRIQCRVAPWKSISKPFSSSVHHVTNGKSLQYSTVLFHFNTIHKYSTMVFVFWIKVPGWQQFALLAETTKLVHLKIILLKEAFADATPLSSCPHYSTLLQIDSLPIIHFFICNQWPCKDKGSCSDPQVADQLVHLSTGSTWVCIFRAQLLPVPISTLWNC